MNTGRDRLLCQRTTGRGDPTGTTRGGPHHAHRDITLCILGLAACEPAADYETLQLAERAAGRVEPPVVPGLWYPLDEHSGGLAPEPVDGYDGVHVGPIVHQPAAVDHGHVFDGTSYMEGPDIPLLDLPGQAFTFGTWLRRDRGESGVIASRGYTGANSSWALRVNDDPSVRRADLEFELCDPGGCSTIASPNGVEAGVLTYVAVVVAPGSIAGLDVELSSREHPSFGGGLWDVGFGMLPDPGFSFDSPGP